jgi:integrase
MSRPLTAAAVAKLRPGKDRLEIPDGACPGLYLVIQPSGARSWALRFRRPNGKTAKLVLGSVNTIADKKNGESDVVPVIGGHLSLAAAHRLVGELRHQIAQGRDPAAAHKAEKARMKTGAAESADKTFAVAARSFIDGHKVRKTGQRPRRWREIARVLGLAYSGDGNTVEKIEDGLVDRWADRPITNISKHDVQAVVDKSRQYAIPGLPPRNEDESDARGRKMADALGAMFKWVMRNWRSTMHDRANPCLEIDRPHAPPKRSRVLNIKPDVRGADELRWFWTACDAVGEPFGVVLRLLLLTGCRLNEIARMGPDELSDDQSMLRLPPERTKNSLEHHVPLPPLAQAILTGVKRVEGCKYVFSTNGKTPVSGWSKIKRRLDAAMLAEARKERGEAAAIAPWRLHDLRRTAATGMHGIGIEPHIVEAVLNHISGAKAGVAGTYNVEQYAAEKKAALERWAAHIEGLVTGKRGEVVPIRGKR